MDPNLAAVQSGGDGEWLQEGIADYNAGGVQSRVAANSGSIVAEITAIFGTPTYNTEAQYAASYLAVRYFDEKNGAKYDGKSGIAALLWYIQDNGGTVDNAMTALVGGAFKNGAALANALKADTAWISAVAQEDSAYDSGAIGGYYATNGTGPARPYGEVVQGNGILSPQPLASWGLQVRWNLTVSSSGFAPVQAREDTLQAVGGTLLLHSPLLGRAGKMTISGDERLINALGFTEIQEAEETSYSITVEDAHTGNLAANGVRISGTLLKGILHENIDLRMANNFAVKLDAEGLRYGGYGSFAFSPDRLNAFVVHIAAQSVVLQIGANEGEDMTVGFGDTSSVALGVDRVNVRDRALAARAITIIDDAIDRVSTRRARLGAYQNRLEHTIANLTVAGENLTASESRIRDADMAKEMMNFTKLQIVLQAGTSMLAQANVQSQNLLALLR
jgi:flagellin-like hook-associated protein FlgL